jgi:hypothetical protein
LSWEGDLRGALGGLSSGGGVFGHDEHTHAGALRVRGVHRRAEFAGQIDWNGCLGHIGTNLRGDRRHEESSGEC